MQLSFFSLFVLPIGAPLRRAKLSKLNSLPPMTKQDEISLLTETARKLGANSYCGEWLAEQIPFVQSALSSDFTPDIYALSISQANAKAREIVADSERKAREIVEKAEKTAKEISERESKAREMWKWRFASDLRQALKTIENS